MTTTPASAADAADAPHRRTFRIDDQTYGKRGALFVFAGMDLAEPVELCLEVARCARDACAKAGVGFIYKGSFDKANRTSVDAHRGPGLERGLAALARVREEIGVPCITDIHLPEHAARVAEVVQVIQIPAFLSRQTDLLRAAAETGLPVSVKKGQFLAPWDMAKVAGKLDAFGARGIVLVERGASFGYNRLVTDFSGISIMQQTGFPVCYDASHAQQEPSGHGGRSGGRREMIAPMARAAAAVGVDAFFFETHPDPPSSPVDPDTHLPLRDLEPLLLDLVAIRQVAAGRQA